MLKSTGLKKVVFIFIASSLAAVAFSSGHFSNPDAHLRLAQAFSLVEGRGFSIKDDVGDITHGNIASAQDGRRYSVYAPGQILLFSATSQVALSVGEASELHPHYIAELLASFIGPLVHFITAFLIYFVAKFLGRGSKEAVIISVIFAFGVMNLPSSRDGYEHTYEAFFLLASVYSAWLSLKCRRANMCLLLAGILLGSGAMFRPNILIAAPALFFIAKAPSRALLVGIGLLPAILCMLGYNYGRFGNLFETGYPQAWAIANPGVLNTFDFSLQHLSTSLTGLLFSPGKGLFLFSPVLLSLFFWGPAASIRTRDVAIPILYIVISYVAFYASNFAWHGSIWSWGPRYLIPVIPFLVLALPLKELSWRARRIFKVLLGSSVVVQASNVFSNYKRHLIDLWNESPLVFDSNEILFRLEFSPLAGSLSSFAHVVMNLLSKETLYTYFDPRGWHNEARPATLDMMLASSIDLNAIDLWWIRLLYFPISDSAKLLAAVLGLSASLFTFFFLKQLASGRGWARFL